MRGEEHAWRMRNKIPTYVVRCGNVYGYSKNMRVDAVINKPKRIATQMGVALQLTNALAPKVSEVIMNTVFRMFNDSAAARGDKKPEEVQASNEQVALAALMKGVHF